MASTNAMTFRFRSWVVTWLPLLVLGTLGLLLWQRTESPVEPLSQPAAEDRWIPMDLARAAAVDQIPGWDVRRGSYRLGAVEGRQVLELLPEPMVEGKVLWTRAMRGGGGVRARMRGDRARRTYPRFSVGLHQERELHLRAFPGERKLELVACNPDLTDEVVLAGIPLPDWNWKPEDWFWLELQILPDGAGSRCEGRLWTEGTARPEVPLLTHQTASPPTVVFAALQGAPFALRSIVIDAAETLPWGGQSSR
jgi:hypothetical protein